MAPPSGAENPVCPEPQRGAMRKPRATPGDRSPTLVGHFSPGTRPAAGWALQNNRFQIADPKTPEERRKAAREFVASLKLTPPVLVDALDDAAEKGYAGWPDRLYVIDAEGKVVLKGRPGPGGFKPA